jgi:hypothetical protein
MREAHFELWMHTFLRFLQVVLHQIIARFAAFLLVAQRCVRSSAAAATARPRPLSAARLWQIQVKYAKQPLCRRGGLLGFEVATSQG